MRILLEREVKRLGAEVTADAVMAGSIRSRQLGIYRRFPRRWNRMRRRVRTDADQLHVSRHLSSAARKLARAVSVKPRTQSERARCSCRVEMRPLPAGVSGNREEPLTTQRPVYILTWRSSHRSLRACHLSLQTRHTRHRASVAVEPRRAPCMTFGRIVLRQILCLCDAVDIHPPDRLSQIGMT